MVQRRRRGFVAISEKSLGTWEHGNIFFSRFLKFPDFQSISFFEKLREFAISKAPHLWFFRENQRFPDAEPRMFANANHANQEFAELRLDPDDFSCYLLIFVGPPSATGWHGTPKLAPMTTDPGHGHRPMKDMTNSGNDDRSIQDMTTDHEPGNYHRPR